MNNNGLPFTTAELHTAVQYTLKNWSKPALPLPALWHSLHLVTQQNQPDHRHAVQKILLQHIQRLQQHDLITAEILLGRFVHGQTLRTVAHRLRLSPDQAKHRQREALQQLTALLCEAEKAARQTHAHTQQIALHPASYTDLFGAEDPLQQLLGHLHQSHGPWIIALVGLGGLGKTSLADAAVRALIPHGRYHQTVWHRLATPHTADPTQIVAALASHLCPNAPPAQQYTQVRQQLKSQPHLIVLDNLETDTAPLLETLQELANPTKFLLTSRHRLPPTAVAQTIPLAELPPEAAFALLRHQAQQRHLQDWQHAPDAWLHQIYAVVGGNPLALKLVVGLTSTLPLAHVLAELTAVQTSAIEEMYRHIYWQAWHSLSPNGQLVLEMMPLTADIGATPEQLQALTELPSPQLWKALTELASRSLLEIRGTTWERRYGIHRLTETFLQTEIIHWPQR